MLTETGQQAEQIRRWAWSDPAARADDGLARLDELARSAEGQALREIQDAWTMLSRLRGTLADVRPAPAARTIPGILDQLREQE